MIEENMYDFDDLIRHKTKGLIISKDISRLTNIGDNYLSFIYKVDVTVQNDKENEEVLHTVAKLSLPAVSDDYFGIASFVTEKRMYEEVIPELRRFQDKNGIEGDIFPELYGARITDGPNAKAVIIFENLKEKGYTNFDRKIGFDVSVAKVALTCLAAFHASSIALKQTNIALYEQQIRSKLRDHITFNAPPNWDDCVKNIFKLANEHPKCKLLVNRIFPDEKFPFSEAKSLREPWPVFNHGDPWIGNILVKRETDKEPKVKFVDLQISPYKSLTADVIVFLVTSIRTDILKSHFDELLRHYHQHFITTLVKCNADISAFGYEEFLKEIKEEMKEGNFMFMLLYLGPVFADETDVCHDPEVGFEIATIFDMYVRLEKVGPEHKERFWTIIEEFAKRDFI